MIHVPRPPQPEFFRSQKVLRAKEKLQKQFNDANRQQRLVFDGGIYMYREVKESLMDLFGGKCAYCESSFASSFGDVEHYRPKGGAKGIDGNFEPNHYWWLAYEWENLLLACQVCNFAKQSYFPVEGERVAIGALGEELAQEQALVLDPCNDKPEEHLHFQENGTVTGLTKRGAVTIDILKLNRTELVYLRKESNNNFKLLLNGLLSFTGENNRNLFNQIRNQIKDILASPSQNYLAAKRAVFKEWYARNQTDLNFLEKTELIENITHILSVPPPKKESQKEIQQVEKQLSKLKRFSIKRIDIKNFRSIAELTLHVKPQYEQEKRESWLLLLGDNGVGKSSILQAITLALAGKKQRDKLGAKAADILRHKTRKGYVKIYSHEQNDPIELHFDKKDITGGSQDPPAFILAYGATRLLPKGRLKPEKSSERYAKIGNLFDYSVALNHVDEWLKKLSEINQDQLKQRVIPALFDLLMLHEEDRIEVKNGKLLIRQFQNDFVLDEVSDGYKAIIALACDIMQTLSFDQASYHATQGIVLIDELGNHLHPRWRMQIATSLRKAFPNLQFIVTTHEPLCLRGLAHGEVTVLIRDEHQKTQALDSAKLPDHNLLRVDQLLTSDLFGLVDTLDPAIEKKYKEYYELLVKRNPTNEEKEQIQEYKTQLKDKEMIGSTPKEQIYYQLLIDETYTTLRTDTSKTVEESKRETLERVKNTIRQDLKRLRQV